MTALVLCCLAAASLLWRAWRRQLSRAELWIALFVVAHFLLIQLQMLVCDHTTDVFWRYHLPSVVLLVPIAARLFSWDSVRFLGRYGRLCSTLLLLVVLAVSLRLVYRPYRRFASWRQNASIAEAWAANVIDADWKGPREKPYEYSPIDYRTNRFPIVFGFDERIAYLVRGRAAYYSPVAWNESWPVEPVDYFCFPRGLSSGYVQWARANGAVLIATRAFGPIAMEVYRMPVGTVPEIPSTGK